MGAGKEVLIVLAIMAALVMGLFVGAGYLKKLSCDAQAGRIGMPYEWSLIGGCLVEERPGIWVPLKNYRVL